MPLTMEPPAQRTSIGGAWEASADVADAWLEDPATGERLAPQRASTPEQVDRAIAAADAAHRDGGWLALGAEGRAALLDRLADALEPHAERIAELDAMGSGVPIAVTRLFGGGAVGAIRQAASLARAAGDAVAVPADGRDVRIHRIPWGATALLLPWNAPIAMAAKQLAFALAAGAPAVLKPSPFTPWSAELLVEAAEAADLPEGVVSLVHGGRAVGELLVGDARIAAISMTGATATGRAIAASAAPRLARMRLELGSSNPAIVLDDASLDETAEAIVAGALKLSGQWCEAPRRVIAPASIADALAERIVEAMRGWRVGASLDPATRLGPTAYRARRVELERQRDALAAAGARILRAGTAPDAGAFVDPTVAVVPGAGLAEEVFGPIVQVCASPDDDVDAALALANTGQVGLAGYVFGGDEQRAAEVGVRLHAGEVKLGGTSVLDLSPASAQSFFGASGLGGHGDADVLDFFVGRRIVGADAPGLPL